MKRDSNKPTESQRGLQIWSRERSRRSSERETSNLDEEGE